MRLSFLLLLLKCARVRVQWESWCVLACFSSSGKRSRKKRVPPHGDSKWLKLAENKFQQTVFTSFSIEVSADWDSFRFRSYSKFVKLLRGPVRSGPSSLGVPGVPWHTQYFADQLTLFQPGGTDYAHLITTGTPGFSDLPTALSLI